MLHITYAPDDVQLAEQMKDDLAAANLPLQEHIMLVLITPQSVKDKAVLMAIEKALASGHTVLPVILRDARLPKSLEHTTPIHLSDGYQAHKVIAALRAASQYTTRNAANRRLLVYLGALVVLIFAISIGSLVTGIVGPPVEEFATENALREAQIGTLIFPTLDPLMPRTTEDAESFPATVQAANTRNAPLLAATATGLVENQQATETARAATQTAVATQTAAANE